MVEHLKCVAASVACAEALAQAREAYGPSAGAPNAGAEPREASASGNLLAIKGK